MIGEVNVYGFYLPWGILMVLGALCVARCVCYLLARFGFYRYVWHPALFDFSLLIIIMGIFYMWGYFYGF
ncbi:MAG: DUF1656 domain-containing protein [Burkholderiaceae bacterium]|jgi:hypothetical protein|nr:DUF1656 domain-containing protein [Burkholderiaceae bacterium]